MKLPPVTTDLVWKLDNLHTVMDRERMGGMAQLEGNPWRIEIRRFGRATAFTSSGIASTYYNKVLGMGVGELGLLNEISHFFLETRAPTCRIDILPGALDESLADQLTAFGLRHVEFHSGFYGRADVGDLAAPDGAVIRSVETDHDMDVFLDLFHRGWQMDPSTLSAFVETMRYWQNLPGWHLYLSNLDGVSRGVGVLFIHENIAYLALAATLPEYRNRGCEQALVYRAIRDAKRLGCELVCGQCDFGSPTGRNLQRFGLQLAYTKAIWLLRHSAGANMYREQGESLY